MVYRPGQPDAELIPDEGQNPDCNLNLDADLNLGFTADDDRASVQKNRELLLDRLLGASGGAKLATVRQVHSTVTHRVRRPSAADPLEGDGMMTDTPGVLLGILTADCVPVLVVDRKRRAVAAFHAGWRGTVGQIVEAGVQQMREEFGSKPEDLLASIGPAIGPCCYTVGEEVRRQFSERFSYVDTLLSRPDGAGTVQLDLIEANRRQLLAVGLRPEAITVSGACTSCHTDLFFSYRADQGFTGRMMAVIGVREGSPA
jgi:YfiH family protein